VSNELAKRVQIMQKVIQFEDMLKWTHTLELVTANGGDALTLCSSSRGAEECFKHIGRRRAQADDP